MTKCFHCKELRPVISENLLTLCLADVNIQSLQQRFHRPAMTCTTTCDQNIKTSSHRAIRSRAEGMVDESINAESQPNNSNHRAAGLESHLTSVQQNNSAQGTAKQIQTKIYLRGNDASNASSYFISFPLCLREHDGLASVCIHCEQVCQDVAPSVCLRLHC